MHKRIILLVSLCFLLFGGLVLANDSNTVAYINIAADGWSVQIWPDNYFDAENNPTDVIGTTQVVDGYGQYTAKVDFSKTENGFISEIGFLDIEISNGELAYPNSFMKIDSFKVNGEEVALGKTYTSSDDDIDTRVNLYNEWVSGEIKEGRTADGTGDVTAKPFNVDAFDQITSIEITFTLMKGMEIGTAIPDEARAYITFAAGDWGVDLWGDNIFDPDNNPTDVIATTEVVDGYRQYTVGADFTKTEAGHANGIAFFDVEISNGEILYSNSYMQIDSVKINGESVALGKTYTSSDDGVDTRTNLYNEWVGDIEEGRTADGTGGVTATPINNDLYDEIETIEVTFTLKKGVELGFPSAGLTAHLSMFDETWENQFILGDDAYNTSGVIVKTDSVKGYDQYTVALDLTKADADFNGIGQLSVVVNDAETYMPYNFIRLDEVKVNGEEATLTGNSYTSGIGAHTKVNIFDDLSSASEDDRTNEKALSRVTSELIDASAYSGVVISSIEATFTILKGKEPEPYEIPESFNAFMMFSDTDEERWQVYNPGFSGDAAVTGDGTFSVYLKAQDLNDADSKSVYATEKAQGAQVFLVDIQELGKAMVELGTLRENAAGELKDTDLKVAAKVFVDGKEVSVTQSRIVVGDLEGNGRLRIELYNAWGPSVDSPAINPAHIIPEDELRIEFTLTGTGIER